MFSDMILVFDADNTLWDTNSVFWSAQLALLNTLAEAGFITEPEKRMEELRILDRELVGQIGTYEYDFRLLSLAAAIFYSKALTAKNAVCETIFQTAEHSRELVKIADRAYEAFKKGLKKIPPLFPDTETILSTIRESKSGEIKIITILFSEGDPDRLDRILKVYKIREKNFFDEIIIAKKNKSNFERVKEIGLKYREKSGNMGKIRFILIGDSLKDDIKLGNQTGFITIYKSSAFKGNEKPRQSDEKPGYTISQWDELPVLLKVLSSPNQRSQDGGTV